MSTHIVKTHKKSRDFSTRLQPWYNAFVSAFLLILKFSVAPWGHERRVAPAHGIDLGGQKGDIHTEIEPEHEEHHRRDGSVYERKRTEMVNIIGVNNAEQHPAEGGDHSTRQLGRGSGPAIGKRTEDG